MPDQPLSTKLSAEQLAERAAGYMALAQAAEAPDRRGSYSRLAEMYADLAAERTAEERQATRNQPHGASGPPRH
jgi:hypothetical protein